MEILPHFSRRQGVAFIIRLLKNVWYLEDRTKNPKTAIQNLSMRMEILYLEEFIPGDYNEFSLHEPVPFSKTEN